MCALGNKRKEIAETDWYGCPPVTPTIWAPLRACSKRLGWMKREVGTYVQTQPSGCAILEGTT
jgi:hypothetical protein